MSDELKALQRKVDRLTALVGLLVSDKVAPERELQGQYGNPDVRKDPKDWTGQSMVGRRFSECPSEFLDMLAAFSDWKAEKDLEKLGTERDAEKAETLKKYAKYAKRDARLARGWAIRNMSGAPAPASASARPASERRAAEPAVEPSYPVGEDDIPF